MNLHVLSLKYMTNLEYYNECKNNKLCASCKCDISNLNTVYCIRCLKNDTNSKKELKLKRKSLGLCIQCGENKTFFKPGGKNFVRCQKCLNYQHLLRSNRKHQDVKYSRDYRTEKKMQVFNAYGGKCNCCNEVEQEFLTVDHVNNDGAVHRREIGSGSYALYVWLIKNNYPSGFQLLCGNCHLSKNRSGICVHVKEKN